MRRLRLALLCVVASLLALAMTAGAAGARIYYSDYNGATSYKPDKIFLTANSGPRLHDLKWRSWGRSGARAHGLIAEPQGPDPNAYDDYKVTVQLSRPRYCARAKGRIFTRAKLVHVEPVPGVTSRTYRWQSICLR